MEMRTRHHIKGDTLIVDLGRLCRVISSAPCRGGLVRSRYILNHQVPSNPLCQTSKGPEIRCEDPARFLGRLARSFGLEGVCVSLMTAVPIQYVIARREQTGELWVEVFCTVGLSNAVQAGEPPVSGRGSRPGTINIIVVTNARFPVSGLVGALQVATESKTSAVLRSGILSGISQQPATGTGTDATVVASGDGPLCRYSGTHTEIGSMIGRAVSVGVVDGIAAWQVWRKKAEPTSRCTT